MRAFIKILAFNSRGYYQIYLCSCDAAGMPYPVGVQNVSIYFGDDIFIAEYFYRELRLLCMRVNGDGAA